MMTGLGWIWCLEQLKVGANDLLLVLIAPSISCNDSSALGCVNSGINLVIVLTQIRPLFCRCCVHGVEWTLFCTNPIAISSVFD